MHQQNMLQVHMSTTAFEHSVAFDPQLLSMCAPVIHLVRTGQERAPIIWL